MKRPVLVPFLIAVFVWLSAPFAIAQTYTLTGQDRVLIRAMQWDRTTGSYSQWPGVSGEYVVSTEGLIHVPLAGQLEAKGKTVGALSEQLQLRLHRLIGTSEPPQVAMEIIGHLPVYVLGDVQNPGAYPYRPGLTSQQALAVSGGLLRVIDAGAPGNASEQLRLAGQIRVAEDRIRALQEERNRLNWDLGALGRQLETGSDAALPTGREGEILAAVQTARAAQNARILDLQAVLKEQITRLSSQIALRDEQIALTKAELENVSSLKERGLTVNTRVSSLNNALNDLEAKRLQLEIGLLTAQQQLNLAEREELTLLDDAKSGGLSRLNNVEQEIAAQQIGLTTLRSLYEEAVAANPSAVVDPLTERATKYFVTRGSDQTVLELTATGELLPGDTIEIRRVSIGEKAAN
ncbi:polysaccharide biosynthesis/export family protein [uncultured Roseobacter sp.]|uniref:polysaccharide biosynthesis/export family protein n=1 Tax=uncultured Roseobacter sp. TaxID=114847 RepID=UPI00260F1574|nr:polysaccharide biosynthesis/export family protein [uncultured Roseobacter sp.]